MWLQTLKNSENRRLLPITVKYAVALLIMFVVVGGATAANTTEQDEITVYSKEDLRIAQAMIESTDAGIIFAMIALVGRYMWPIALVLLALVAVVARLSNNSEKHSWALQGMFMIIFVLFVLVLTLGFVTRSTPDISTITFGT